jgi:hypothetical protein
MNLKLKIEATVTADAIKSVTDIVDLIKSEDGVAVTTFKLEGEGVAERPVVTVIKSEYHRPWMKDPRCVLIGDTFQIDIDATVTKMGTSLHTLRQVRHPRGTLEAAVKIADGQRKRHHDKD